VGEEVVEILTIQMTHRIAVPGRPQYLSARNDARSMISQDLRQPDVQGIQIVRVLLLPAVHRAPRRLQLRLCLVLLWELTSGQTAMRRLLCCLVDRFQLPDHQLNRHQAHQGGQTILKSQNRGQPPNQTIQTMFHGAFAMKCPGTIGSSHQNPQNS
jgi:hypothetical protein